MPTSYIVQWYPSFPMPKNLQLATSKLPPMLSTSVDISPKNHTVMHPPLWGNPLSPFGTDSCSGSAWPRWYYKVG